MAGLQETQTRTVARGLRGDGESYAPSALRRFLPLRLALELVLERLDRNRAQAAKR